MSKPQKQLAVAEKSAPSLPDNVRPVTITVPQDDKGRRICPRYPVAKLLKRGPNGTSILPPKFLEALEQNQKIASCCRHPENHEIEGLKSHPDEPSVDIYIFYCTCGRLHRRFCVGGNDVRPVWVVS